MEQNPLCCRSPPPYRGCGHTSPANQDLLGQSPQTATLDARVVHFVHQMINVFCATKGGEAGGTHAKTKTLGRKGRPARPAKDEGSLDHKIFSRGTYLMSALLVFSQSRQATPLANRLVLSLMRVLRCGSRPVFRCIIVIVSVNPTASHLAFSSRPGWI